MTGVGRIKAKMKIMASLGENLYKTTHVYKDWTNKEKVRCALARASRTRHGGAPDNSHLPTSSAPQWSRFRANEKEGIIAYQARARPHQPTQCTRRQPRARRTVDVACCADESCARSRPARGGSHAARRAAGTRPDDPPLLSSPLAAPAPALPAQKWKEFEALKKSDDEKRRLRLEAAADLSAAGEGAVSPGTAEAGENGAAPGAVEPGTPAASASSSS